MTDKMREAIIKILNEYTQEMESYTYYRSNRGVSVDDYEDIADEIIAWQAAKAVPVVWDAVALDADIQQSMEFYNANNLISLVRIQSELISRLQKKLPLMRDEQPRNPRSGGE